VTATGPCTFSWPAYRNGSVGKLNSAARTSETMHNDRPHDGLSFATFTLPCRERSMRDSASWHCLPQLACADSRRALVCWHLQAPHDTPKTFSGPFEGWVNPRIGEKHGGATSRTPTDRPSPSGSIAKDHRVARSRSPGERPSSRLLARLHRAGDAGRLEVWDSLGRRHEPRRYGAHPVQWLM
jgi:hypothetical protein